MRLAFLVLACLAGPALVPLVAPAFANDGFGGLSATGLTFGQTEAVAMVSEDLTITPDRITVDYVFRNTSAADVTGEVIFPLPPVGVWASWESMMNLPEDQSAPDLVNFTASVDGQPVAVTIDRIAVIEPPWDEARPLSEQYDTPGREVTADLARLGIPLTLEVGRIRDLLLSMPPEQQARATAAGLADFYEGDPANNIPPDVWGTWSIVTRYHWTQTFPAGQEVRIRHTYDNRPPGGLFMWSHPPEDWQTQLVDQYCIDEGTSRAMARALKNPEGDDYGNLGSALNISYVLRTANSWAGPIGSFRLTLDKGAPENVISLCASGVKKTGPTTFVIEKTDYTPDRDLEILIVQPLPRQ